MKILTRVGPARFPKEKTMTLIAPAIKDCAPASAYLSQIDDDWAGLIKLVGVCSHQPRPEREPYEALVRAVAYQQLHVKAGDAILGRLLALHSGAFPAPQQLLSMEFQTLRVCGFSAPKIETLRGIAEATLIGIVLDRHTADQMPDDALIERLVSLRGIGRWTVKCC